MSRKINWKITIEELDRGRIITVGCKKIAFDGSVDHMLELLGNLYSNPQGMYKLWFPEDFKTKGKYEPVPTCGSNQTEELEQTISR
ncbi:MAG: hypothetical protein WCY34_05460 [Candidatus Omnitrophota bacterium]